MVKAIFTGKGMNGILFTCKDNASILGMNQIWCEREGETPTTSAADKQFADSAQTALLSTANSVKLAGISQHSDVVFTWK